MSASVAGPSTPSPMRDWILPMPQEISTDSSFSNDLIRQFDKKRSRLRVELKLEQHASDSDSVSTSRVGSSKQPIRDTSSLSPSPVGNGGGANDHGPLRMSETAPASIHSNATIDSHHSRGGTRTRRIGGVGGGGNTRRRSAGDLLRRSSAFLRAKIESLRGPSRSHDNLQRDYHDMDGNNDDEDHRRRHSIPPPSKIVVNTTIAIPQFNTTATTTAGATTAVGNNHHGGNRFLSSVAASIQPPVITQYPPKPLKYSPVEPTMLEENQKKSLHHRISMPVLRNHLYNNNNHSNGRSNSAEPRRRSDVGVDRMGSIGKRARKALGSPCTELKNRGGLSRKGKEPMSGASPASTTTSSSSSSAAQATTMAHSGTSTSQQIQSPPPPMPSTTTKA
ncbi:hypothetical protein BDA99DRAFT_543419 [Phascolomyces articulosus]|uniref:Uncharacterized protein n=1 Tax=Phascolomyces articulosus TaxID=60185 RepID=A0AAD5P7Z5_9FUNG|nr:hypothetical protein BDA99DRAFT_543419 [Phascolomyces articulosus]